jgi:DNA-binding MarR family transcriptional regulator
MDRETTVDAVLRKLRRVNLEGSLFGQRVAVRFGLSESDIEALEALIDTGASTAGSLGELMGLTSGAITRLIDRLEQSGYVRRVSDPADRRRVIIEVVPDKVAAVKQLLDTIRDRESAELGTFSETELRTINDFLSRMADIARTESIRLHTADTDTDGPSRSEHTAPLGGLTSARLIFRSGANELALHGAPDLAELYRARFEGSVPRVTVRDGTVSIQHRGMPFDWRKRLADVTLNASIPWSVQVQGGANKVNGQLEGVDLRSFELTGGAANLNLAVGRPAGEVPIRIVGGTGTTKLVRPAGVGVKLHVAGGVGRIELDGQRITNSGSVSVESAGDDNGPDRYAIEVLGGSARIEVSRRPPG